MLPRRVVQVETSTAPWPSVTLDLHDGSFVSATTTVMHSKINLENEASEMKSVEAFPVYLRV